MTSLLLIMVVLFTGMVQCYELLHNRNTYVRVKECGLQYTCTCVLVILVIVKVWMCNNIPSNIKYYVYM